VLVNAQRSAVEEDHGRRGVDRSRENRDDRLALADVHEVRASPGAGMVQQLLEGGDRSGWVVVGAARPEKYVVSEGSVIRAAGALGGVMTEVGTDEHVREEACRTARSPEERRRQGAATERNRSGRAHAELRQTRSCGASRRGGRRARSLRLSLARRAIRLTY